MLDVHRRASYSAPTSEFVSEDPARVLGILVAHHDFDLEGTQRRAWQRQIEHLQQVVTELGDGHLFLEFAIPRMGKRADAVLLLHGVVYVLEYKVGADSCAPHAIDQVVDYALDLKNFHEGSHSQPIVPLVVATNAPLVRVEIHRWPDDVLCPICVNAESTGPALRKLEEELTQAPEIDAASWVRSSYKPTPTIVEAAQALYQGHDVREISRSEAGAENLTRTGAYIDQVIERAKREGRKAICFVTGVPGSGKTLAGLTIANTRMKADQNEHAVFLSGNGPLVEVLREALAIDEVERSKEAGSPVSKSHAKRHAATFIQNIHHFRDQYLTGEVPLERVVVFDEAQRAWTKEQASKFMREKRDQEDFNQSEPAFLLSVMDRHSGWCVVVCLIGGGQEINTGEAGLGEWLRALADGYEEWDVHLSSRLSDRDYLASGQPQPAQGQYWFRADELHLAVSVRSFRAEAVSDFVAAVIAGDADRAKEMVSSLNDYPLVLTRDLESARSWLRRRTRGTERIGLVASSNALRLKPVGIHVRAGIDPASWFLKPADDVRSSFALEDVGTEFDVQGLELDWVGVCWDANLRYIDGEWKHLNFRGSRWEVIGDPVRQAYLANAYRVLMTRARQGMVLFVPQGSPLDKTRDPRYYDGTYQFLRACGLPELEG
jgi:hypothetical protein